ncbi:MAG TPA: hypothetical protein VF590_13695 [Isosphaeraceae bacterium]|jgi:hypothetical protein
MMRVAAPVLSALALGLIATRPAPAAPPLEGPMAERYLMEGRLAAGETALREALEEDPKGAQARFGLGVVQFLRGVERLVQTLHRYGLRPDVTGGMVPFARLPVPPNPDPRRIDLAEARAIFQQFLDDLARAEATLAQVDEPDVTLPLHFGRIRLDLDGDGHAAEEETLWRMYTRLNRRQANLTSAEAEAFVIAFDRGDVAWLRGYCHLLMALSEAVLAYDGREPFNHAAHLFFPKVESPFGFLQRRGRAADDLNPMDEAFVTDAIALVHVLRLPVAEPRRMTEALGHLEAMIACSRASWKHILAEADDDHEWIPNPKQGTVMPGGRVSQEMVRGWMDFLDEAEALLDGRTLVPFWRDAGGQGVNLRRVFTEPGPFDLVLWVQGTAAVPYLEEGRVTTPEVWRRLQRVFGGEFFGFALWIN